ncbi:hypothetical protein YC2023_082515 [Brassica napus]
MRVLMNRDSFIYHPNNKRVEIRSPPPPHGAGEERERTAAERERERRRGGEREERESVQERERERARRLGFSVSGNSLQTFASILNEAKREECISFYRKGEKKTLGLCQMGRREAHFLREILGQEPGRYSNEEDETSPSSKFDSLPFDLKMAIVSRMDVSSLMKFRCVSKIWSSIIRSRGFIDSFFSMSSKHFKKPIFYEGFSYLVLRSTTSHIYIDVFLN